jgi:HPr kinase/phosphorylase
VDRTGLDTLTTTILDVEVPLIRVPLNPGKNITVIAEVIALNHLLRYSGIDPGAGVQRETHRPHATSRRKRERVPAGR